MGDWVGIVGHQARCGWWWSGVRAQALETQLRGLWAEKASDWLALRSREAGGIWLLESS